jgi:flagellar biosynthesis/type III secretory pathway protein FliH
MEALIGLAIVAGIGIAIYAVGYYKGDKEGYKRGYDEGYRQGNHAGSQKGFNAGQRDVLDKVKHYKHKR